MNKLKTKKTKKLKPKKTKKRTTSWIVELGSCKLELGVCKGRKSRPTDMRTEPLPRLAREARGTLGPNISARGLLANERVRIRCFSPFLLHSTFVFLLFAFLHFFLFNCFPTPTV